MIKICFSYGAIMAVSGAVFTLLLYFAGFHDNAEKLSASQWLGFAGSLCISATCLALAMRAKRMQHPPEANWGYGFALGTGMLTSVCAVVLGVFTTYLYFAVINPGIVEVIRTMQLNAMEAAKAPNVQIQQLENFSATVLSILIVIAQAFVGFVISVTLSFILAIFFRSRAVAAPPSIEPVA